MRQGMVGSSALKEEEMKARGIDLAFTYEWGDGDDDHLQSKSIGPFISWEDTDNFGVGVMLWDWGAGLVRQYGKRRRVWWRVSEYF